MGASPCKSEITAEKPFPLLWEGLFARLGQFTAPRSRWNRRYLAATAAVVAAAIVVVAGSAEAATAAAQQDEDDDEPSAVTVTHGRLPPFKLHSILWHPEKSVTEAKGFTADF